ncbi:FliM/FliN family flagellar motor switch protein [Tropicimonas sp. TH_r6]|uniref:FliM/FliN family flagellar motor switch protein n=1 Tax=Tropicimonas sp. TH_r6 TaxID=3082085 RepID=UPI0029545C02|nr:FliM/FliN family flagellar motor switch protein [Tropicimonas sp. TH_r6]MDV7143508.1 FliM/FliN family flagellar motor switch protein [Tropicimonas sp. TH_r6]
MADAARKRVLRRKVEAGRESAPANRAVLPARALSTALSKAAEASMELAISATSSSERIASLPDLLERLPENGLLAVLEGPEDGQGLMAFDFNALSAVIEKQMTGAVGTSLPPSRRATRTDAALAADLIDAVLQRFEQALAGRDESRWASGFGYSSHVEDLRPLGLLLEEIDYRIFGLSLDFEMGTRTGEILLALPAEGRGTVQMPQDEMFGDAVDSDPFWSPSLQLRVLEGEVQLDAVLHRFHLPISAISELKPGDEIPIPLTAIDNVRLSGAERIPLGRCRLGSSQGFRALRLGADGAGAGARGPSLVHSAALAPSGFDDGHADGLPSLPDLPGLGQPEDGLPDLGGGGLPDISGGGLPDIGGGLGQPMAIGAIGDDDGLPDIGLG